MLNKEQILLELIYNLEEKLKLLFKMREYRNDLDNEIINSLRKVYYYRALLNPSIY